MVGLTITASVEVLAALSILGQRKQETMPDAVLASVFVLMLVAPCAFAVSASRRREREFEAALAEPKRLEALVIEPALAADEKAAVVDVSAPAVAEAEIVVSAPVEFAEEAAEMEVEAVPVERRRVPRIQSRTATFLQKRAERAHSEALMAQVVAAKADAAALMALAKAAAAKADAAAELAAIAAREMEEAAYVAATVRDSYAKDAQGTGPKSPLPETHPSLDFPRSRGRRAA